MKMVRTIFSFLLLMFTGSVTGARPPVHNPRIIIATDRDVYVAGDRLYFMVFLQNGTDGTESYVNIILNNASGFPVFNGCLKLNHNQSYGSIYLADTLTSGIYQLVSFTNHMRNRGSAYYERKNVIVANRFDNQYTRIMENIVAEPVVSTEQHHAVPARDLTPEITTNKTLYGRREKITITISGPLNTDNPIVSVSVRQVAPVSFIYPEFPGEAIESGHPCYWLPEKTGLILQGCLRDEKENAATERIVFLSGVDTVPNLQHTVTDRDGIFRFFLNPWYFGKMLSVKPDRDFKGTIHLDNRFETAHTAFQPHIAINGDLTGFLEESRRVMTIAKSYQQDYFREESKPDADKGYRPHVYLREAQVVYPSDFTWLPDFVEISREILPLLKTRIHNDKYEAHLLGLDLNNYMDVFIFVDGLLIEDISQIISFDSGKIRKIEMVPYNRFLDDLPVPGILSIVTTDHKPGNLIWKLPVKQLTADSIMHRSTYVPPDALSIPAHIPDFRQLLFWYPNPGNFSGNPFSVETRTSDCTGEFEIVVTSCDSNGNRIETTRKFNVMNQ